jgi:hypothetical protein
LAAVFFGAVLVAAFGTADFFGAIFADELAAGFGAVFFAAFAAFGAASAATAV